MGLIKTALNSAGGVLADQWKEYFYCDALEADVLAAKGQKRTSSRSNNRGNDNIISSGSIIAVADGQCMLIVEQGKVVDVCAEPGEYKYDASTEPSIFSGKLGESIKAVFKTVGKRFTFGADTAKDQRVYYFNTKELIGNKYGTPSPVPFRVVDARVGLDMDIAIRCFGEYSYHISNPLLFYTNICGNVESSYTRDKLDSQLKTEVLTALQPAFAQISEMGIRYSALPGHTVELANAMNNVLTEKWRDLRGIEIVSFGVSSVKAPEEDEQMIKELQRNAAFKDPTMAAAHLVGAQATAMQNAAKNENGAAMAFMGMNMAAQNGGMNAQNLYQMGQQMNQQAADSWKCSCGAVAIGKFCAQCGAKRPEQKAADICVCPTCGAQVSGKFCTECGARRPGLSDEWVCSCGAVNKAKFCAECGAPKPQAAAPADRPDVPPQYKCSNCGWVPEDPAHPPKFCPECGDTFGSEDIVK